MEVSVVHIIQYLMERQLDETASRMLQAELESQGMKFLLEKNSPTPLLGKKRVTGLRLQGWHSSRCRSYRHGCRD